MFKSLLPITSKVFQRQVFNTLFNFFLQNKIFTPCQSGFILGDSCVSQLLSITHETNKNFDCHPPTKTRGTFGDISKAFDKVWHEGLIIKLKTYGIVGNILKLQENYLIDRHQRVVTQGSALGPLLFLIYINDLLDGLNSRCEIFANDFSLLSKVFDKNNSNSHLDSDLTRISKWAFPGKLLSTLIQISML